MGRLQHDQAPVLDFRSEQVLLDGSRDVASEPHRDACRSGPPARVSRRCARAAAPNRGSADGARSPRRLRSRADRRAAASATACGSLRARSRSASSGGCPATGTPAHTSRGAKSRSNAAAPPRWSRSPCVTASSPAWRSPRARSAGPTTRSPMSNAPAGTPPASTSSVCPSGAVTRNASPCPTSMAVIRSGPPRDGGNRVSGARRNPAPEDQDAARAQASRAGDGVAESMGGWLTQPPRRPPRRSTRPGRRRSGGGTRQVAHGIRLTRPDAVDQRAWQPRWVRYPHSVRARAIAMASARTHSDAAPWTIAHRRHRHEIQHESGYRDTLEHVRRDRHQEQFHREAGDDDRRHRRPATAQPSSRPARRRHQQRAGRAEVSQKPAPAISRGFDQQEAGRGRRRQGVDGMGPLIDDPQGEVDRRHGRGPHDGGATADHPGVGDQHDRRDAPRRREADAERPQQRQHRARQQRDVAARDGDDVVGAGLLQPLFDLGRQLRPVADEDGRADGGGHRIDAARRGAASRDLTCARTSAAHSSHHAPGRRPRPAGRSWRSPPAACRARPALRA